MAEYQRMNHRTCRYAELEEKVRSVYAFYLESFSSFCYPEDGAGKVPIRCLDYDDQVPK